MAKKRIIYFLTTTIIVAMIISNYSVVCHSHDGRIAIKPVVHTCHCEHQENNQESQRSTITCDNDCNDSTISIEITSHQSKRLRLALEKIYNLVFVPDSIASPLTFNGLSPSQGYQYTSYHHPLETVVLIN